jgi:hypothetical protein
MWCRLIYDGYGNPTSTLADMLVIWTTDVTVLHAVHRTFSLLSLISKGYRAQLHFLFVLFTTKIDNHSMVTLQCEIKFWFGTQGKICVLNQTHCGNSWACCYSSKLHEPRETENLTILPVINWKFETAMNAIIWHHRAISEDCFYKLAEILTADYIALPDPQRQQAQCHPTHSILFLV